MRKVFVSSVIEGFEDRRQAVRQAIELMGHQPVMAEHDFPARPYSPRVACLTEVSQSDVYLLLMGERYGYKTSEGISVTQAEFREAKRTGRPVLALIEECEMELQQAEFCREVEDLETGFYRKTFSSADEAKDRTIEALRLLDQAYSSATESQFKERLEAADDSLDRQSSWNERHAQDPELICAWWPQPVQELDIVGLEKRLDQCFDRMCEAGLAVKRNGYREVKGADHTGVACENTALHVFEDGLHYFIARPTTTDRGYVLSSMFVSPSQVRRLTLGAATLFEGSGAWCNIRLQRMEHKNFAEPPESNQGGVTVPMGGENSASLNKKFIPFTLQAYRQWVDLGIGRFGRIFEQRH